MGAAAGTQVSPAGANPEGGRAFEAARGLGRDVFAPLVLQEPQDERNGAECRVVARMPLRSYNRGGGGHLMQETNETLSELKQRIEHVLRRL